MVARECKPPKKVRNVLYILLCPTKSSLTPGTNMMVIDLNVEDMVGSNCPVLWWSISDIARF
jgi:hypothetical protein